MVENELHVFLDTESLDNTHLQNKNKLDRLLLYNNKKPFIFQRSSFKPNTDAIANIKESDFEIRDIEAQLIRTISNELLKRSLTDGEKVFLHLIIKHASTHEKFKNRYIDNAVFITENFDFLDKFIATDDSKQLDFRAFFPSLRLVSIDQGLEVLDIFAKSNGYYFGTRTGVDITPWYKFYLFSKLTHCPAVYKNIFISSRPSEFVRALVFRFVKVLLCIDYLGEQHYFGKSRKELINPIESIEGLNLVKKGNLSEKVRGFVSLDDNFLIFYHIEYLVSLTTGIFDNLAIETAAIYQILLPNNKISLSSTAGRDFLRDVKNKNAVLKNHIDSNRDFINLPG